MRLAHVPGDLDDDRTASGPRDMSIKVLDVAGEKLPGYTGKMEEESAYVPVGRLVLPAQGAWTPSRQAFVDDSLLLPPSHSLAAHRPLGSIQRV